MMAAELRSPHQRRSDQLSILTRRPAPLQTPARFSKTLTDATCVNAFDPAFDSDADTEGPASGSSAWRRDFSRILSNSSAGLQTENTTDVEAVAPATAVSEVRPNSFDHRTLSDDITNLPTHFSRERACSFYGKGVEEVEPGDDIGPVTKATLKDVLHEDYELYSAGVNMEKGLHSAIKEEVIGEGLDYGLSGNDKRTQRTMEQVANALMNMKSAPEKRMVRFEQPAATRKARSIQVFGERDLCFSLDSDSRSESDEMNTIGREVEHLLTTVERPRLTSVTVPLFVEEIGRIPRAAIVEGKVKRVRVHGETKELIDDKVSMCGAWMCLEGDRRKRRKKRKRKPKTGGE